MARAVSISATFLMGRYHGQEWPPSPARMIQALVAGVCTGGYREMWPRVEQGLLWLERRPAPFILTRPVRELHPYRLAVPNNDLDVVAHEWAAGRPADPAKIRTIKEVTPTLVEGGEPHVRYLWPLEEAEDADSIAAMLRPVSHCLYALGWGVDMAYADVEVAAETEHDGWERWAPSPAGGQQLVVPVPGFTADLQSTYRRFTARASGSGVDTDTRPTVYRLQRYVRKHATAAPWVAFDLLTPDGESLSEGWHATMKVAAWMRHAAAEALRDEIFGEDLNAFVLGHAPDGTAATHRMSFVPLPSIGHTHTDGRVRRVMFVEPATGSGRPVELLCAKLPGASISDEDGHRVCSLAPATSNRVIAFYTANASVWRSVTPVVLHGYNSARGAISVPKTESLLIRAFEMAGYEAGMIERLAFQAAPLWSGTGAAGAIRVPQHLSKNNYPRYHVEVRFRRPVPGPVLAGIGRHYGIGTFAATPS